MIAYEWDCDDHVACRQVCAAIKHDKANLQLVHDEGGFTRITQLLQWLALTFGPRQGPSHVSGQGAEIPSSEAASLLAVRRLSGSHASTSAAIAVGPPPHPCTQPVLKGGCTPCGKLADCLRCTFLSTLTFTVAAIKSLMMVWRRPSRFRPVDGSGCVLCRANKTRMFGC